MDTVVRRGADVGSDHYLVETRLKLKLKRNPREMNGRTRLDTQKLADQEMFVKYNIEVRNRFQALTELEEENADHINNRMENIYVLGIAKSKENQQTLVARRDVEESRGKETTKAEVRKSQEKNKRTVQEKTKKLN